MPIVCIEYLMDGMRSVNVLRAQRLFKRFLVETYCKLEKEWLPYFLSIRIDSEQQTIRD